jgi:hypothetical protein
MDEPVTGDDEADAAPRSLDVVVQISHSVHTALAEQLDVSGLR